MRAAAAPRSVLGGWAAGAGAGALAVVLTLLVMMPMVLVASLLGGLCQGSSSSSVQSGGPAVSGDLGDMPFVGKDNAWIDATYFGGNAGRHGECAAYPVGQCTRWACERRSMLGMPVGPYWGNGGQWGASARAEGLPTSTTPVPGAAVAFAPGQDGADAFYGHIAIVEKVDTEAGTILISEMNVQGPIVSTRTLSLSEKRDYVLPSVSTSSGWPADEADAARRAIEDSDRKKDDKKDSKDAKKEEEKEKSRKETERKKDSVAVAVAPTAATASCSSSSSQRTTPSGGGDGTIRVAPYDGDIDGWHASPDDARRIAREMVRREWPDGADREFDCLDTIVVAESAWTWDATNPDSGAYGIPQSLPASKLAAAGDDWRDDAATQIRWMLDYIEYQRAWEYGTPCQALAVRNTRGWY